MILSFKNASAKRRKALEQKQKEKDAKRKAAEEVKELEAIERRLLQAAKEEADLFDDKVMKLKRFMK